MSKMISLKVKEEKKYSKSSLSTRIGCSDEKISRILNKLLNENIVYR